MKAGIDRIIVKLIEKTPSPLGMVDVKLLPQEAKVIEVGMDTDGLLEMLVKKDDIVVLTPESKGLDIHLDGELYTIIRKHNIELIK